MRFCAGSIIYVAATEIIGTSATQSRECARTPSICDDQGQMPEPRDHAPHGDGRPPRRDASDGPHDVLAAEEFAVGAGDASLHADPVHDVLAAEEFAVGAPAPALHPRPVVVPPEPGAGPTPHDVLAADEFAVPAGPRAAPGAVDVSGSPTRGRLLTGMAFGVLATLLWRRRRP
jgi:hypothetical protein